MIPHLSVPVLEHGSTEVGADLVVDCPGCRRAVVHPGVGRDGGAALAECRRCDIYFIFDPGSVRPALEPKGEARPCP